MIALKIDVKKIDKARLFAGAKGTYLDAVLVENRDGTDQYGNDGFVAQSVSKEDRQSGVKGAIIGNWKHVGKRTEKLPRDAADASDATPADDLPF